MRPKENFRLDTLAGDASLLHLASEIDRGIKKLEKLKLSANARKWKKRNQIWKHLKHVFLFVYIALTAFERPSWCNKINNCVFPLVDGKIDTFKPDCQRYS